MFCRALRGPYPNAATPARLLHARIEYNNPDQTWMIVTMTIELIAPNEALHQSWLDARTEWGGPHAHQPGTALGIAERLGLNLGKPEDFKQWVQELNAQPHGPQTPDTVPATNWWITHDDRYLGAIQLRHSLNDFLADLGGHIGYGIRPTERRKGVVTIALRQVLDHAATEIGLDEVLITCDDTNIGSQRTIEAAGGVLHHVRHPDKYSHDRGFEGKTLHYWVPTNPPTS
ncbi:GNAT family N-acetyltransferase [Rhodococcus sp. OK302]|uniref:GNAT family N-acetyltransferase n=1 Tax=Rhodococcus sp. OK302 TaxID=1882769 RepID=UPI000B9EF04A|nr:GNAT family N-acetyltransferase [Rhodococcus sp. OK302]OYD60748.1 putative acetyltransferase [Rhodococcus sp. OK302]